MFPSVKFYVYLYRYDATHRRNSRGIKQLASAVVSRCRYTSTGTSSYSRWYLKLAASVVPFHQINSPQPSYMSYMYELVPVYQYSGGRSAGSGGVWSSDKRDSNESGNNDS